VSEAAQLRALVSALLAAARVTRERRLLLLAGERTWGDRAVDTVTDLLPEPPFRYTARDAGSARAIRRLGSEHDALLIDARDGFDADACGALAGTLRGGGLMLLLTPPLDGWPTRPDRALARWLSAPYDATDSGPYYRARLVALLRDSPATELVEEHRALPAPPAVPTRGPMTATPDDLGCLTTDQHRAVEALLELAGGKTPGPLVLTADRGRGKSAALGLATAQLLAEGHQRILVTAPRRAAAAALFAHAGRSTGRRLRFVPPDELLRSDLAADLLLIDEAAAIPTAQLTALLGRYPRCAFATTVHGYEGTGRGFAVRFRATLDRRAPGWCEVVLRTPVRWAAGDPLEPLLFRALLLDSEPAAAKKFQGSDSTTCSVGRLDRDLLATDPQLLDETCGLLVQAHYRTTPNDLRLLLDAPGLSIHAARHHGHVAAVAVTLDEGGFDTPAAFEAWRGTRRRRGHLVAQSLATHAGFDTAPRLHLRRVQRIAVHPAVRRQGLATRLIEALEREARADGLDLLCTSFGATAELLAFWSATGFTPARLGFRRDAASGAHALIALRPLSPAGEQLARAAQAQLGRDLDTLLGGPLRDLDEELACTVRAACPVADETGRPNAHDWAEACAFAFARRAPDAALPAVRRLLPRLTADSDTVARDPVGHDALVARFADFESWDRVAARLGASGRDTATERLRGVLRAGLRRAIPADQAELVQRLEAVM